MNNRMLAGRAALELLVVFLGVLCAFWVEGWRISKEERTSERHYLERLSADLRADSAILDDAWIPSLEQKFAALGSIAPYVRGQTDAVGDTLAFIRNVSMAGAGGFSAWTSSFQRSTMEDLTATGNLRLIRNPGLRAAIVRHYQRLENETARIRGRVPLYPMAVHALSPAEDREGVDMEALRAFGVGRILARVRTEAFQDILNQEYNSAVFQRSVVPGLRDSTSELIAMVDAELAGVRPR